MEKAVIVGPYHFIGIHLCSVLLEKGYNIIGISYPNVEIDKLEDKKMVFGRNSNFMETKWSSFVNEINQDEMLIIFDFYTLEKEDQLVSLLSADQMEFILIGEKRKKKKIVIICPNNIEEGIINECKHLLDVHQIRSQVFYLPTVYGPWQPENFLFQQILTGTEEKAIRQHKKEYTKDAIYIEDAMEELVNQILQGKDNDFLLKSKVENHWHKCLDYLQWHQERNENNNIPFQDTISTIAVNNKKNISENLEVQRKHIKMYID
ncbi:hypothetical protein [Niallia sp. 01092]|uniref:hypothetical protein n=1 Tax=unclassified Niallia TaxID=2837522 RepID=UPI003FD63C2E